MFDEQGEKPRRGLADSLRHSFATQVIAQISSETGILMGPLDIKQFHDFYSNQYSSEYPTDLSLMVLKRLFKELSP